VVKFKVAEAKRSDESVTTTDKTRLAFVNDAVSITNCAVVKDVDELDQHPVSALKTP
jgi:hypothetical protein